MVYNEAFKRRYAAEQHTLPLQTEHTSNVVTDLFTQTKQYARSKAKGFTKISNTIS